MSLILVRNLLIKSKFVLSIKKAKRFFRLVFLNRFSGLGLFLFCSALQQILGLFFYAFGVRAFLFLRSKKGAFFRSKSSDFFWFLSWFNFLVLLLLFGVCFLRFLNLFFTHFRRFLDTIFDFLNFSFSGFFLLYFGAFFVVFLPTKKPPKYYKYWAKKKRGKNRRNA